MASFLCRRTRCPFTGMDCPQPLTLSFSLHLPIHLFIPSSNLSTHSPAHSPSHPLTHWPAYAHMYVSTLLSISPCIHSHFNPPTHAFRLVFTHSLILPLPSIASFKPPTHHPSIHPILHPSSSTHPSIHSLIHSPTIPTTHAYKVHAPI
jgi:hypothetical protein